MNTPIGQYLKLVPITLMAIMALTRFDHFGSALSLAGCLACGLFLGGNWR